jgi:hypothetical protein
LLKQDPGCFDNSSTKFNQLSSAKIFGGKKFLMKISKLKPAKAVDVKEAIAF